MKAVKILAIVLLAAFSVGMASARPHSPRKKHHHAKAHHHAKMHHRHHKAHRHHRKK